MTGKNVRGLALLMLLPGIFVLFPRANGFDPDSERKRKKMLQAMSFLHASRTIGARALAGARDWRDREGTMPTDSPMQLGRYP
jgi:hypothetical protein